MRISPGLHRSLAIHEFSLWFARETGKPLWEARTEVESVIAKVEISVTSYAERTSQRRLEGNLGAKTALRHKPHGVLGVLGPYNFPAHLPNGHIVPALIAGNAVVFKPSEKTPATGAMLVECFHAAGVPSAIIRLLIGGAAEGKALAAHEGIDGILFTGAARTGIALNRQFADMPGVAAVGFGLSAITVGTIVHCIEMKPGAGAKMARSAGTYAQLVGKDAGYAQLKLMSGEVRTVRSECLASIGAVSNPDNSNQQIGKAGRSRWLGRRPHNRGVTMNPIDHPHGGGEGRTSGGRHPVTPWGKPTKGAKTRNNKRTDRLIVRRRNATKG